MSRLVMHVLVCVYDVAFLYQLHMVSVSPQGEQAPTKTILKALMARKFTFYSVQTLFLT